MSDPLLEQTRSGYDAAADTYAEHLPDTSFEAPIDMAMVDHFAHMLPRAATVLDAGCGTGRMLRHLQDRDGTMRLTGVDISSGMLAHAARRGIAVDLRQSDLAALPFDDATFAGVLAWYSIIHTAPDGLRDVITEVRRVLRPDGVFLLGFQAGTGTRTIERPYGQEAPSRRSCTSRRRSPGSCGHSGSASTPSSTARPGRWSGTGRGSCSRARRADQPTRRTDVHGTVLGRPDPPPA